MTEEQVTPKPKISFYLKNASTLMKMRRANKKSIEQIIALTKPLQKALIPAFEGTGGPMEEGMIYLLFNSEDGSGPIDSVFRVFWVNSPILNFSFFDSFLVSSKLRSGRWERKFPRGIFENLSANRFHQETHFEECELNFDGTWSEGYQLTFNDHINELAGNLEYRPLTPEGVLTYYNGQTVMTPSMVQRFYDMFAIKVSGELEAQGKKLHITDGRGIIEHGLGIFSGFNIYLWRWLDLQFPEGSVHLFYHPIILEKEGIIEAGEGATIMDGKWYHFPPGHFKIEEKASIKDDDLSIQVPVEWRITAGEDSNGEPLLDLSMNKLASLSWRGNIGPVDEYITNFVLEAKGTWKGKPISGRGTMENLTHQKVGSAK